MLKKDQKTDVQVTKNFNLSEMEFFDTIPPNLVAAATELLQNLQVIRDAAGKSVTIISGYRSPERNKEVGGAQMSQHMFGNAADIKIKDMTPDAMGVLIEKLISEGKIKQGGLGIYPRTDGWVHYDIRGTKARWRG
jgi:uncharacterized protein YcbK (DUF882 family)